MIVKRINNLNPRFCLFKVGNKVYMVDMYSNKFSYISLLLHTTFKKKAYIFADSADLFSEEEILPKKSKTFWGGVGISTLGVLTLRGLSNVYLENNIISNALVSCFIFMSIFLIQRKYSLKYFNQVETTLRNKINIEEKNVYVRIKFTNKTFYYTRNIVLGLMSLSFFSGIIFTWVSFLNTGSVILLIIFGLFLSIIVVVVGHLKYFSNLVIQNGAFIIEV